MSISPIKSSSLKPQLIDLSVLAICFAIFAYVTDFINSGQLQFYLLVYVALGFVSLRFSKYLICKLFNTSSGIASTLVGNIIGFMVWVFISVLLETLFAGNGTGLLVVIFSSIMAFFILGTLSPMEKSSHHDIIRH